MIIVDKEKCIGCGTCQAICPENFQLANDGKAEAISQEDNQCVREAKDMCPAQAISI